MKYWLFKSEPDTFSIDDLKNKKTEIWDGVRNYQARNFLRDEVRKGDQILFYHSSCKVPGIAGLATVHKHSVIDPTQFDPKSPYFDPKSDENEPRWITVEVKYKKKFKEIIDRPTLMGNNKLKELLVLKKGMRLSIMPVEKKHFDEIIKMAH